MKRVTVATFARRLDKYLDEVDHGQTIVLTRRGRPVARLQLVLKIRPALKPLSEIAEKRYRRVELTIDSTELLALEHGHGDPKLIDELSKRTE